MSLSIIIVGPTPPPIHGASRVTSRVVELAKSAAGPERQVLHVSTSGTGWVKTARYHLSRVIAHLNAGRVVLRRRVSGPVTLYVAGAGGLGLVYQAGLIALARLLGCRSIFHHHSYSYLGGQRSRLIQLICWFQRPGDAQIMLTPHMVSMFTETYATAAKLVPVSNAFAVASPRDPVPGRSREVVSLIHVSNLSREKGTDLVLDALGELRERGVTCTLTLIGRVRESAIGVKLSALQRRYPNCIEYLGEQDQVGVEQALDLAHLMVFPSMYRNEAQPMVVLEALARGVPALVSKRGSMVTMVPPEWQLAAEESVADGVERILVLEWDCLSRIARHRFADMQSNEGALLQALGIAG